ncbi:MAG: zinc ribbon domain-containing protein [Dehalococcoidia bacterium]|nr:zinc ribbon domain-containing protein [Dehalococcoidia bacterium]
MPLYEYYCEPCDGIYEALRPMREAADPVPCPACDRDGRRIMPTSINAFTFREGYPRRLPDKGTYWHLGKEVKTKISGRFRPFEHPELNKPKPPPRKSKGDREVEREKKALRDKEFSKMRASGVRPMKTRLPRRLR